MVSLPSGTSHQYWHLSKQRWISRRAFYHFFFFFPWQLILNFSKSNCNASLDLTVVFSLIWKSLFFFWGEPNSARCSRLFWIAGHLPVHIKCSLININLLKRGYARFEPLRQTDVYRGKKHASHFTQKWFRHSPIGLNLKAKFRFTDHDAR